MSLIAAKLLIYKHCMDYILHRDAGAGVHDKQLFVRYKLLDVAGDFHVGAARLAGVRDEVNDIQDKVGIG